MSREDILRTPLGDGVYAELVGQSIRLTTSSCSDACYEPYVSNTIYLDPDVVTNLLLYIDNLKREITDEHKTK